ncbi:hypothetical protein [Rossellomorea aquimaris]|uniref:hypothetical protein n=1 Tax=Rossellomorea aquimaris TaxID=189382 RepID=UPI0007D070C1|nr:hypothetical protein [Rossellomorea aquimaris]
MNKDQQEILDVLNHNRNQSEKLLDEMKSNVITLSKEAMQDNERSKASISSTEDVIQRSLQILSSRGISVDLPITQFEGKVPKQSNKEYYKRDWKEIVKEAHTNGFQDTTIEDLLTPQEITEADLEYIEVKKAFSQKTRLNKTDISFLLLAVALQCVRQYIFANDKFRFNTAKDADKAIKRPLKNITPNEWKEFLLGPVPYDAVTRLDPYSNSTGLSANTHRYRTLGHDPILGWVFGPVNILSRSLTKTDIISTYEIIGGKIGPLYNGMTMGAMQAAIKKAGEGKYNLPAAVVKQAIHFGSDYFTKQGLPLPFVSSLDNNLSQKLIQQYSLDTYCLTRGASMSMFINSLMGLIHQLFYNEKKHGSKELYEVRTRKVLLIANTIASSSNIIYVALSKELKKLDLGGILVTIYRIISDLSFISRIKKEFMLEQFDKSISKELDILDSELSKV